MDCLTVIKMLRAACSAAYQNGILGRRTEKHAKMSSKCGASTKAVLRKKLNFESLCDASVIEQNQNLVLIQFSTEVAGHKICDSFLWPRHCRNTLEIKIFAVNLLSDLFGRRFGAFDCREIECKLILLTI